MNALIVCRDPALRDVLRQALVELGLAVETSCPTFDPRWCLNWSLVVLVGERNLDDDARWILLYRSLRTPVLYLTLDNRFPPPWAVTLRAPFDLPELEEAVHSLLGARAH